MVDFNYSKMDISMETPTQKKRRGRPPKRKLETTVERRSSIKRKCNQQTPKLRQKAVVSVKKLEETEFDVISCTMCKKKFSDINDFAGHIQDHVDGKVVQETTGSKIGCDKPKVDAVGDSKNEELKVCKIFLQVRL